MAFTNKQLYITFLLSGALSVVYYMKNNKIVYLLLGFFLWLIGTHFAYNETKDERKKYRTLNDKYFGGGLR